MCYSNPEPMIMSSSETLRVLILVQLPLSGPLLQLRLKLTKVFLLRKRHSGPVFRSFSSNSGAILLKMAKNCPHCVTFSQRIFLRRRLRAPNLGTQNGDIVSVAIASIASAGRTEPQLQIHIVIGAMRRHRAGIKSAIVISIMYFNDRHPGIATIG